MRAIGWRDAMLVMRTSARQSSNAAFAPTLSTSPATAYPVRRVPAGHSPRSRPVCVEPLRAASESSLIITMSHTNDHNRKLNMAMADAYRMPNGPTHPSHGLSLVLARSRRAGTSGWARCIRFAY